MYNRFFGLRADPFCLTLDPKFLFLTLDQRQVLARLTYGLMGRKRCLVLTGDVGTGKTTLLTAALRSLPADRFQCSLVSNPTLTPDEVLETILLGFGMTDVPSSKAARLHWLESFVDRSRALGRVSAIAVDEAHKLSLEALESIRLLGNLDALQIVLAGQTELRDLINREEVRALKQRIALSLRLEPLSEEQTGKYILHRWMKAGGAPPAPFDLEALELVTRYSGGVPRLVNAICDNALLLAYAEETSSVGARFVFGAVESLDLPEPAPRPAARQVEDYAVEAV